MFTSSRAPYSQLESTIFTLLSTWHTHLFPIFNKCNSWWKTIRGRKCKWTVSFFNFLMQFSFYINWWTGAETHTKCMPQYRVFVCAIRRPRTVNIIHLKDSQYHLDDSISENNSELDPQLEKSNAVFVSCISDQLVWCLEHAEVENKLSWLDE